MYTKCHYTTICPWLRGYNWHATSLLMSGYCLEACDHRGGTRLINLLFQTGVWILVFPSYSQRTKNLCFSIPLCLYEAPLLQIHYLLNTCKDQNDGDAKANFFNPPKQSTVTTRVFLLSPPLYTAYTVQVQQVHASFRFVLQKCNRIWMWQTTYRCVKQHVKAPKNYQSYRSRFSTVYLL